MFKENSILQWRNVLRLTYILTLLWFELVFIYKLAGVYKFDMTASCKVIYSKNILFQ